MEYCETDKSYYDEWNKNGWRAFFWTECNVNYIRHPEHILSESLSHWNFSQTVQKLGKSVRRSTTNINEIDEYTHFEN